MTCPDCERAKHGPTGLFDLNCAQCRERFVLSEPCKISRQHLAKYASRFGKAPDWKVPPSCTCARTCLRRQSIRNATPRGSSLAYLKKA